ncbi:MAG: tetrahydromethanopterin S-methyltransferase subunit F [Acidimicrobiales bacterium]|jgi:tetrahydromethanopterin S-methyltransferase subunit F
MDMTELQEHWAGILAEEYSKRTELQKYDMDILIEFSKATVLGAWPEIVDLPDCKDNTHCVSVTPNAMTNVLSCIIGSDPNIKQHTGRDATAQTGTFVAGVCGAAIGHVVGGTLMGIDPFGFSTFLPIGVSAIITLSLPEPLRSRAKVLMTGHRADNGKELFKPAEILLVRIPTT